MLLCLKLVTTFARLSALLLRCLKVMQILITSFMLCTYYSLSLSFTRIPSAISFRFVSCASLSRLLITPKPINRSKVKNRKSFCFVKDPHKTKSREHEIQKRKKFGWRATQKQEKNATPRHHDPSSRSSRTIRRKRKQKEKKGDRFARCWSSVEI